MAIDFDDPGSQITAFPAAQEHTRAVSFTHHVYVCVRVPRVQSECAQTRAAMVHTHLASGYIWANG